MRRRVPAQRRWWRPGCLPSGRALQWVRQSITVAAGGAIAIGTATGTAAPSITEAERTTGTMHGTAAITGPALRLMVPTALRERAMPTIRPPERTREAHQFQRPTERQQPARRTTQTPGPTPQHIKRPTPTETMAVRFIQRTAIPRTPSTRRLRTALWERYRLPMVAGVWPGRMRTGTLLPANQQTATSMRLR